jgi:hypothetical protein
LFFFMVCRAQPPVKRSPLKALSFGRLAERISHNPLIYLEPST